MNIKLLIYKVLSRIYGISRIVKSYQNQKFRAELARFSALTEHSKVRFDLKLADAMPCMDENTAVTGFDRHYIYHPAWAARMLAALKPAEHVDISSSLHFCSLVSAFIKTRFYDYRPAPLYLSNLTSEAADLLALPFDSESIESLSCMHVVEHIGLGRYGDPMDYDGDIKAAAELARVVSPKGSLLFVVPVGRPRIAFNAHRIYSFEQVVALFPSLTLKHSSLVPDDLDSGLVENPRPDVFSAQEYGCGCFWFVKE